jgi:hypothetical protein
MSDVYVYESREGYVTHVTDGDSFLDDSPLSCAERLQSLKAKGYQVPQSAIDALRADALLEEAAEA